MASTTAAAEGAEDLLEVWCAGCGETLEVERGLTEFICPDCSTAQALPPELMPPPRRRRALPIPSPPALHSPVRLPCGSCGALLSVPLGLARRGCPVCGAELAVDAARLRQYLCPPPPQRSFRSRRPGRDGNNILILPFVWDIYKGTQLNNWFM